MNAKLTEYVLVIHKYLFSNVLPPNVPIANIDYNITKSEKVPKILWIMIFIKRVHL